jgi:hypothetical protein
VVSATDPQAVISVLDRPNISTISEFPGRPEENYKILSKLLECAGRVSSLNPERYGCTDVYATNCDAEVSPMP